MKVVVDKDIPFLNGVLEPFAEVVYLAGSSISNKDLRDADALIVRTRTTCDKNLLSGTRVKFIASATIGYDHIDTDYCNAHDIQWTNAAGCNSSSVQQYIAAVLFHLSNKMEFELADKTIGIVGVGNVGTKVATFCRLMGMRVLLNDPPRERKEQSKEFVTLKHLTDSSDIVTLHVPLALDGEDKTYHLVGEKQLSEMRPNQILINTSRGEVVDGKALTSSLRQRKLLGCVLDVWENEPSIDLDLLHLVNVGTPHIAGYSADGKANGTSMSVQALSRFFKLGLDDWLPKNIPMPENPVIELDCAGMRRQKIFCKLVTRTYDIQADDQRLRNSPAHFEHQRTVYPLRREFPAYAVRLRNTTNDIRTTVELLGFNLEQQPYEGVK